MGRQIRISIHEEAYRILRHLSITHRMSQGGIVSKALYLMDDMQSKEFSQLDIMQRQLNAIQKTMQEVTETLAALTTTQDDKRVSPDAVEHEAEGVEPPQRQGWGWRRRR